MKNYCLNPWEGCEHKQAIECDTNALHCPWRVKCLDDDASAKLIISDMADVMKRAAEMISNFKNRIQRVKNPTDVN